MLKGEDSTSGLDRGLDCFNIEVFVSDTVDVI